MILELAIFDSSDACRQKAGGPPFDWKDFQVFL
jgi:hypothetical protein